MHLRTRAFPPNPFAALLLLLVRLRRHAYYTHVHDA